MSEERESSHYDCNFPVAANTLSNKIRARFPVINVKELAGITEHILFVWVLWEVEAKEGLDVQEILMREAGVKDEGRKQD